MATLCTAAQIQKLSPFVTVYFLYKGNNVINISYYVLS
jgi:hypothetical protein